MSLAGIYRLAVETAANIQNPTFVGLERPAQRALPIPTKVGIRNPSRGFNRQAIKVRDERWSLI